MYDLPQLTVTFSFNCVRFKLKTGIHWLPFTFLGAMHFPLFISFCIILKLTLYLCTVIHLIIDNDIHYDKQQMALICTSIQNKAGRMSYWIRSKENPCLCNHPPQFSQNALNVHPANQTISLNILTEICELFFSFAWLSGGLLFFSDRLNSCILPLPPILDNFDLTAHERIQYIYNAAEIHT